MYFEFAKMNAQIVWLVKLPTPSFWQCGEIPAATRAFGRAYTRVTPSFGLGLVPSTRESVNQLLRSANGALELMACDLQLAWAGGL